MKTKSNKRFQLRIDTDSVLISQAPNADKSRVLLTNISEDQLKHIARSIIDADLQDTLIDLFRDGNKAFL